MKFTVASVFAALALAPYLPGILASPSADAGAGNNTAVANNGTYVENENDAAEVEKYLDDDVNLDENDISGSLSQHVEDLMFLLGVCNFDINSLVGLGVNDQIQLILQLQQLQQLQALGLIDSFGIAQLVQQELFLNNFNLSESSSYHFES